MSTATREKPQVGDVRMQVAQTYLERGWPVVPVHGKRPTINWQEYQERMPSRELLNDPAIWRGASGLALVIGPALHEGWPYLWVLDIEQQHRERAELWLDQRLAGWRESLVAQSGGGGLHVYFKAHEPIPSGKTPWGDIKGAGGIIVLPPSTHASGEKYRWLVHKADPMELHPSHLPRPAKVPRLGLLPEVIAEGDRNSTLFKSGCKLRRAGLEAEEIAMHLERINELHCKPPIEAAELRQIVKSVCRYDPGPQGGGDNGGSDPSETPSAPTMPPAPVFPNAALPDVARRFVEAGAVALDCAPELLAMPMLALTGGVIGNRLAIQLTPAWKEYPILWTVTVAPPGSAKSPAQSLALDVLSRLQAQAMETYRKEQQQWEQRRAAGKKSAKHGDDVPDTAPTKAPEPEHFYSTDSTIEAVVRMLGHGESRTPGLTMVRDELVSWVRTFDAYRGGKGGERQQWMTLWSGAALKSDRASRESYWVERPVICVTGGIQPDMLRALESEAGARDGFLERFLFAYPEPRAMQLIDAPFPSSVLEQLAEAWARLRLAPRGVVRLDADAKQRFKQWHDANVQAQARSSGLLLGSYAKLPGQAGRLALVLHALTHPDDPAARALDGETMQAALDLTESLRQHLHRVVAHFGIAAQLQDPLATRILRAIERRGGRATTSEIHDAVGSSSVKAREIQRALEALERNTLVVGSVTKRQEGGRPSWCWSRKEEAQELTQLTSH